ncbi:MAG TPA: hypothetical protein PK624_05520 [Spirochaetota bacterium]|nr:hypothetical protein [Spirochaetota bacterium]HOR44237.1 hypothetical protein [Spirochaetota bacterium]HOU84669.1 hypothetical protein [Spirochaetota bacterium]HPK55651.1 hypothetical protein [Spirochaetota bacterium]HQE57745.1 hypothetical protein [Spirochaetota bacterium]
MIKSTHCLSCGAPLVHELLISNKLSFKCHYCGRTYLSTKSYSESSIIENKSSINEDLNSPAERPANTKLRLISKPGIFFYAELKGRHDFKTTLFAVIFSLSFVISISFAEAVLINGGNTVSAIALMWGSSLLSVIFMISNAKRAGLKEWSFYRVMRNILHLVIPNAVSFLLHLSLFPLLHKEDITIKNRIITMRGRNIFSWKICRDTKEIKEILFKNAQIQPLFSIVFNDACWHLGINMSLEERRWVKTEIQKFLDI